MVEKNKDIIKKAINEAGWIKIGLKIGIGIFLAGLLLWFLFFIVIVLFISS